MVSTELLFTLILPGLTNTLLPKRNKNSVPKNPCEITEVQLQYTDHKSNSRPITLGGEDINPRTGSWEFYVPSTGGHHGSSLTYTMSCECIRILGHPVHPLTAIICACNFYSSHPERPRGPNDSQRACFNPYSLRRLFSRTVNRHDGICVIYYIHM